MNFDPNDDEYGNPRRLRIMKIIQDKAGVESRIVSEAPQVWFRRQVGFCPSTLCSPLRRFVLSLVVIGFLPLCGCTTLSEYVRNGFKVGPNYSRPAAPVASEWIDYKDPRVKSQEADMSEWWRAFNDPTLSALIDRAYNENLSLRVAGARILQFEAQRGIAAGTLFPQIQQGFFSYTRTKFPTTTGLPEPPQKWLSNWSTGLNASWELDLWGRIRRAIEAADADLDASVENYDNVLVVLLADVASAYVQYRTFEQRLVYARHNLELQTKSYQLVQDRVKQGADAQFSAEIARQNLEQTRALIPLLEIGERQARNLLCVLLGIPPSDIDGLLGKDVAIPKASNEVAVGIPADLLRRRPDVRQAERLVAAQSARIGIADAEFYPRLTLNGSLGLTADQFGRMFHTPGSMTGFIMPEFRWDILNYGRILNGVRAQDAIFEQLAFTYQNTVLTAARETEDALIGFLRTQTQKDSLAASVAAARESVRIANDRYQEGGRTVFEVYYFESILTQQEDQLAVAQGQIALDLIAVYRALGGGWEMRLTRDSEAIVDNVVRPESGMRVNERPRVPGGTPDAGLFKVQGTQRASDAPTISPVKTSQPEGEQLPASVGKAAPHKQLSEHVWE
jgi:NodT family efflux transporter outer membrane factor (OMF) lipoprotein